eukprot:CAMPEP_0114522590 /NCGR_PEP_ID=MMETSP0109-20121206/20818_1 /TAXON_ID=29199 /ORGANISM="Chlorarachnion reptans, Strain CCCM449" /LENGTH=311 /DNA_ID=CAMNT_0001703807 /DNA_START=237 /DNA_END=1172 /DNA_ORIENTATION=+
MKKGTEIGQSKGDTGKESVLPQDLEKRVTERKKENLRKAALLRTLISKENAQIQEKQRHLLHIRRELAKVDKGVADQINILRDRIDSADREYARAKAIFDAAEKKYLVAKKELSRAEGMKSLLTQHLGKILMHTEDERANRLSNLLEELNIKDEQNEKNEKASSHPKPANKQETKQQNATQKAKGGNSTETSSVPQKSASVKKNPKINPDHVEKLPTEVSDVSGGDKKTLPASTAAMQEVSAFEKTAGVSSKEVSHIRRHSNSKRTLAALASQKRGGNSRRNLNGNHIDRARKPNVTPVIGRNGDFAGFAD